MVHDPPTTVPERCDEAAAATPGQATAPEVVARLIPSIRAPAQALERLRFAIMADDLGRLDCAAAAKLLDQPLDRFGGVYGQLACYVLGTLAVHGIAASGLALTGGEQLLGVIREQIRSELVRLPAQLPAVWLVPASADEQTAVHVAALLLMGRGDIAKPWLWAGIPDHGPFHIIGEHAADHPAVDDPRCAGALDLLRLARNQAASSCAADQPADLLSSGRDPTIMTAG